MKRLCLLGWFGWVLMAVSGWESVHAEDFSLPYEEIFNSPEAQQIVRYGDVDNLGFGWPQDFDPFSGNSTPVHSYPWTPNSADASGTDRIMVISSYTGSPPKGQDGYTSSTSRPANSPRVIAIQFTHPSPSITSAILQIFVDDFQAPVWGTSFQVTMNNIRVQELEDILNSLNQTGPIGKLISFQLPDRIIANMQNDKLEIFVDDPVTGAGDGFAFDFFRLLINPVGFQKTGKVSGHVYDSETKAPLTGASVTTAGVSEIKTDSNGYYEVQNAIAGLAALTVSLSGYESKTSTVDVIQNQSATLDFYLKRSSIEPCNCPDSDKDGVPDAWDRCPNTPLGSYVDRYGCPNPVAPIATCDVDKDGKTGLAEAIRALQITVGASAK